MTPMSMKPKRKALTKTCPICLSSFIDHSVNQIKATCSVKCRYKLYYLDTGKHQTHKLNMRRYILERAGATFTDQEWYQVMADLTLGLCAICNTRLSAFGRAGLHIDHNHTTNKLRSVLCPRCNRNLPWYENLTEDARSRLDKYLSTT